MDQTIADVLMQHGIPTGLLVVFIAFCWRVLPKVITESIKLLIKELNQIQDAQKEHTHTIEGLRNKMEETLGYQRVEHSKIIEALDLLIDNLLEVRVDYETNTEPARATRSTRRQTVRELQRSSRELDDRGGSQSESSTNGRRTGRDGDR